ncbi:MAG: TadE/TadG family type IV pilus assembly protein [Bdellovibrionota bacterium]
MRHYCFSKYKWQCKGSGTALTEFAIIFPILFVLLLGMVDLCLWLQSHIVLSRIAYEGVRFAAEAPNVSDQSPAVLNRITKLVAEVDPDERIFLSGYSAEVTVIDLDPNPDNHIPGVQVIIRAPFQGQSIPLLHYIPFLGETVHASASSPYLPSSQLR